MYRGVKFGKREVKGRFGKKKNGFWVMEKAIWEKGGLAKKKNRFRVMEKGIWEKVGLQKKTGFG